MGTASQWVVTTLQTVIGHLREGGDEVKVISPDIFNTVPLPVYPEIKLAVLPTKNGAADRYVCTREIHIATEGPFGWAARHLFETGLAIFDQLSHEISRIRS